MRLTRALEDKKMDVRLVDKMLHEGRLDHQEVKSYYEQLPDDAENATTTEESARSKSEAR